MQSVTIQRKDGGATESRPETANSVITMSSGEVDSSAAEAFISEKRIGERIKRLRLKKSMGLVELGKHAGLSASFLSQLETGRVVPTLRNLARIALIFNKDLSFFFESEPVSLFRVHRKQRPGAAAADRRRRSNLLFREHRLHGAGPTAGPLLRRVPAGEKDAGDPAACASGLRVLCTYWRASWRCGTAMRCRC